MIVQKIIFFYFIKKKLIGLYLQSEAVIFSLISKKSRFFYLIFLFLFFLNLRQSLGKLTVKILTFLKIFVTLK